MIAIEHQVTLGALLSEINRAGPSLSSRAANDCCNVGGIA
jgi:hypothetical protein